MAVGREKAGGNGLNGWFRREKNPVGWGAALWVDRFLRVRFSSFCFLYFSFKIAPPPFVCVEDQYL